jgi:apolipoprotein N-acyltransferase
MKYKIRTEIYLLLFAILFILMYLGVPLIEFIFLIPLFYYINYSKKINWLLTIIIISISALINFFHFYGYGFKFLVVTAIAHLLLLIPFIYTTDKLINKKYSFISIPSFFFIIFFLLHFTIVNNFWINLAGSMIILPEIIRYIGSFGVVYLVVIFNYVAFEIINNYLSGKKINKSMIFIIIVLLLVLFIPVGVFDKNSDSNSEEDILKVVGIQGNIDQNWGMRTEKYRENFEKYKALTEIASKYKPDVIIWPEYTFTHPIEFDFMFLQELNDISLKYDATLIVGSIKLENTSSQNSKRYNTLYIFENNNINFYHAYEPVTIFDKEVVKAKNNTKFDIQSKNIGLALCYEENFRKIFNSQSIFGAEAFFTIGNQYYIKGKQGLVLTSHNSRIRAAETNKHVFRLETAGYSIAINNLGKIVKSIPINTEEILFYEMPLLKKQTFYSKYYNVIEYTLLFFAIIFVFIRFYLLRTKPNKNKNNCKE